MFINGIDAFSVPNFIRLDDTFDISYSRFLCTWTSCYVMFTVYTGFRSREKRANIMTIGGRNKGGW